MVKLKNIVDSALSAFGLNWLGLADVPTARNTLGIFQPITYSYLTAGTNNITIPTNANFYYIQLVGGGGGAGSGRKGATSTGAYGGMGANGGAYSFRTGLISELLAVGSTLTIAVGSGGVGGASQTINSTNGNNGTAGGSSTANISGNNILRADGGSAGLGGTTSAGSAVPGTSVGFYNSQPTIGTNLTSTPANPNSSNVAAGTGASAGSIDASNVPRNGASGGLGALTSRSSNTGNPTGGTTGGTLNGANGSANIGLAPGNGAGAGAASIATDSGNGGNGIAGSGGGGGAASRDSTGNSGKGGDGGSGFAIVMFW